MDRASAEMVDKNIGVKEDAAAILSLASASAAAWPVRSPQYSSDHLKFSILLELVSEQAEVTVISDGGYDGQTNGALDSCGGLKKFRRDAGSKYK